MKATTLPIISIVHLNGCIHDRLFTDHKSIFLMIAAFLTFAVSSLIDSENYEDFFGNNHVPVAVLLTSQHCPHCRDFAPTWKELETAFEGRASVKIASISCNVERRLCRSFPDDFTPSVFWVTTTPREAEQFTGAMTLGELSSFIEKHVGPSVVDVESEEQLAKELADREEQSVFMCQGFDSTLSNVIADIAVRFEAFPCYFLKLGFRKFETDSAVLVNYFSRTNVSVRFDKEFTPETMSLFVQKFAYPPISPFSAGFIDAAKAANSTVLILADRLPHFETNLRSFAARFDPELRSCVLYCENNPRACYELIVPSGPRAKILMYNPSKRYIWYYRDVLDGDKIVAWTNSVLAGSINPSGPGAGLRGFANNIVGVTGTSGIVMMTLVVSTLIIVFVIGISDTIRHRRRRLGYHKMR